MTPTLLTDKTRLQEIYDLRVTAYENSPKSIHVNRKLFPNGWFDTLDPRDETLHWIIEEDSKIIASARLAICNNIKDTNEEFDRFELPKERPFAYWSRLVVHPNYRSKGAMIMLDNVRKNYLLNNPKIKFALSCATEERLKVMLRLDFKYLGDFMYNWEGRSEQVIKAFLFTQLSIIKV